MVARGDEARWIAVVRIAVVRRAFPRGYDQHLNLRAPRDGPGGLPPDLDVQAPRNGPWGPLRGSVVWFGGVNGATQEAGREPRHGAGAAGAVRVAVVPRNLH